MTPDDSSLVSIDQFFKVPDFRVSPVIDNIRYFISELSPDDSIYKTSLAGLGYMLMSIISFSETALGPVGIAQHPYGMYDSSGAE